jgi:hypothetical protein
MSNRATIGDIRSALPGIYQLLPGLCVTDAYATIRGFKGSEANSKREGNRNWHDEI